MSILDGPGILLLSGELEQPISEQLTAQVKSKIASAIHAIQASQKGLFLEQVQKLPCFSKDLTHVDRLITALALTNLGLLSTLTSDEWMQVVELVGDESSNSTELGVVIGAIASLTKEKRDLIWKGRALFQ